MDYLQYLLDNSNTPLVYAFILGLMTAISPCPLAMNITAVAFISKDIDNRKRIFFNGLIYTLGRAITYVSLGLILYFGANTFKIAQLIEQFGQKYISVILILIGVLMLDLFRIRIFSLSNLTDRLSKRLNIGKSTGVLLLGVIYAMAFCPTSGVFFFMMLVPLCITSIKGIYFPFVYALGTGLPVIITSYLIAFTLSGIAGFYNKMKLIEKWIRYVTSMIFILTGIYYLKNFF